MAKLTLTNLENLENETTAVVDINANNDATETALENTLSRDGTSPNAMGADLDMNGFQILNLPAPTSAASPARLQDVTDMGAITIPDTGTSGHVIPYLDGANTWSGVQTFSAQPLITAATPASSDDSTKIATTAFVQDCVAANAASLGSIVGLSVLGTATSASGSPAAITGTASKFLQVNAAGNALGFVTLAGDATLSGPTLTLATVNANVGSFGSTTAIPNITVNAKGLITAASTSAVVAPAGTLTGTALASGVVTSSLTNVASSLQIGAADAASPTAGNISAQSVVTGTSDTAGVNLTVKGSKGTGSGAGGNIIFQVAPKGGSGNTPNSLATGLTVVGTVAVNMQPSVVVGNQALATTATDGFLYIPGGSGPPTGVPTSFGGRYPLYWDTTNKKLYVYDTSWLGGTAPGVWS